MELTIRHFEWDDLPALVDVINCAVEVDQEDQYTNLEALRVRFEQPYFDPQDNCLIAVLPDGRISGMCTAELHPLLGVAWGMGYVHPAFRKQGIGTKLLRAADDRHRERAHNELQPDMSLVCTRHCRDTSAAVPLFEAEGYEVTRVSWFMRMDLSDPVEVPPLPEGIALRPFDRERDAVAVHQAQDNIFCNNWGYMTVPHEVWAHYAFSETFDPSLWLVAMDGDQIAGLCLCRAWGDTEPGLGWVEPLGVRSDWRKRGLGSTLLRYGLQKMQAHGFTIGGLEVDSENTTNAVALYERAGMHVHKRYLIYRKAIRGPHEEIFKG